MTKVGIGEHIAVISRLFSDSGYPVVESEELDPDKLNVIIDEFTSSLTNRYILNFREKHPETKIIYYLTEFPTKRYGIETFNGFDSILVEWLSQAVNDFVLIHTRKDLTKSVRRWRANLLGLLVTALLGWYFVLYFALRVLTGNRVARKLRCPSLMQSIDWVQKFYWRMRYLGLNKMFVACDGVLTAHRDIGADLATMPGFLESKPSVFGEVFPIFSNDTIFFDYTGRGDFHGKREIEMTGRLSGYRNRIFKQIRRALKIERTFFKIVQRGFVERENFVSGKRRDYSIFSMHIPQTQLWPKVSPLRIYRSIETDRTIPLVDRYFYQHPVEELAFPFDVTVENWIDGIPWFPSDRAQYGQKLKEYNRDATTLNMEVVKKIEAFFGRL
jgi:hypothetical protein